MGFQKERDGGTIHHGSRVPIGLVVWARGDVVEETLATTRLPTHRPNPCLWRQQGVLGSLRISTNYSYVQTYTHYSLLDIREGRGQRNMLQVHLLRKQCLRHPHLGTLQAGIRGAKKQDGTTRT